MKILRARDMGFCYGVRRAVSMMEEAAATVGPLTSYGSVVHNPRVVEKLRQRGVEVIASLEQVDGRPVAITAHGVGPDVIRTLEEKGATIVDATCPIVTRAQQWARKLTEEGYGLVVFGDRDHKEVRGILGWARGRAFVARSAGELDTLPDWLPQRLAVLSQTTETRDHFASFVQALLSRHADRIHELRVINTLCDATTGHQAAAEELAAEVDLMLVVGGRESANTRHLAEVCRERGVEAYHIESADEIDPAWLRGRERVGVTAGASTPDEVIDEVVARLESLSASARD